MAQVDSQIMNNVDSKNSEARKKHTKIWLIVICIIAAVAIIATAGVLYVRLYKIPHDEAVNNFQNSVDQFRIAEADLEKRNKELDDSITSLSKVVYAEDIPIDEFLLSEANSILEEARSVTKDSAPPIPEIPKKTDEINEEASKILESVTEVQALGEYGDIIDLLSTTEAKYLAMIEQFKNCTAEVVWTGIDAESTVLRFVVKINNANSYTLRGVTTEWIAYDNNDAIVGSYGGPQPDIPANSFIYYVGGAGSVNLSGTPARVEVRITTEGLLSNRELPKISVSDIQIKDHGYNWFTVSAVCETDSEINTADLDGQIIVKNADGAVINADFWHAENLPDSIAANGRFILSEDFFDLPTMPKYAEVYMYYIWQ